MASSRIFPTAYVISTYGVKAAPYSRHYDTMATWVSDTQLNLSSVTTTDQDSAGTTLYVTSTTPFANCVIGRSTIRVGGQTLIINGVTDGDSLTVSAISGTIATGNSVACGFVLECYDDAAPYNDTIEIAGATSSADYFRVICAASGHRGTQTSGVRFEVSSAVLSVVVISLSENYAKAIDIAAKSVTTGVNLSSHAFMTLNTASYQQVIGCTAYGVRSTGTKSYSGIALRGQLSKAINCFVNDCSGVASAASGGLAVYASSTGGNRTVDAYNCTVTNCGIGVHCIAATAGYSATLNLKNTISQDNTTNILSDGVGTATINQTTNVTSGVTFQADGCHLDPTDSGAIDQGTDLSSDAVFPFDDDIDGNTRTGTWDVGCDEYIPSADTSAAALLFI